jgi:hypothetical protein
MFMTPLPGGVLTEVDKIHRLFWLHGRRSEMQFRKTLSREAGQSNKVPAAQTAESALTDLVAICSKLEHVLLATCPQSTCHACLWPRSGFFLF